jgi:hypothetical protein
MDDERIRQLSEEVLSAVRGAPAERETAASIDARLKALEAAVRRLEAAGPVVAAAAATLGAAPRTPATAVRHPSLRLLDVPGGDDRCILEPDQPCEKSGRCRSLGF